MALAFNNAKTFPGLASIDALIASQADKIELLESHKKGLEQNIKPRPGYLLPRLRFPGFSDPIRPGMREWRKIEACMASIEELIALHVKKLAMLQAHRNCLIRHLGIEVSRPLAG